MTTTPTAPAQKVNRIGQPVTVYQGGKSTLCQGCGHDSISRHITSAAYDLGLQPHMIAKFSGIGCSSKTPAYFLGKSHSFNSVHGRMPSVATGALVANRDLLGIGVSGDGDTASIGLGQFMHLVRRNVPMVYIIENNGVYGLTKGQFSATADQGAKLKHGDINDYFPIDCCLMAIHLGATFVARTFSGDRKQLDALMKAAMSHRGFALLDIVSPCVTFNNHEGSTKSYDFVKEHEEPIHDIGFVPSFEEITVDYDEGTTAKVALHDGSQVILKKLSRDYDPTDKKDAVNLIMSSRAEEHLLTGLLYVSTTEATVHDHLKVTATPLALLPEEKLRPGKGALKEINQSFT